MIVGVPKEIKTLEKRVAMTPAGVQSLTSLGHKVLVEPSAGEGSGISDAEYEKAGAMRTRVEDIWKYAELIVKVKEPQPIEIKQMSPDQIIFTYFHLAADKNLTLALMAKDVICVAYETLQLPDGFLPLLIPMSEVAGRLSVQAAAWCLEAARGKGILLGGVSGVPPAHVVIIGAGVAGSNACSVAVGMGARVTMLDTQASKLNHIRELYQGRVETLMSNRFNLEQVLSTTDAVISSVLIPGAKAPKLIDRGMMENIMKSGSVFVDISIDQGGCADTSHPTTHADPIYVEHGVVHYCVANMPGAVPMTSTYALTNATLPYVIKLAEEGGPEVSDIFVSAMDIYKGVLRNEAVKEAHNL